MPMETPYVRQLKLGPMDNFVYLVGTRDSPEVLVVDPAWDVAAIERAAAEDGKQLACAIVSHCHGDHVNALPELLSRHDIPVYAQQRELDLLRSELSVLRRKVAEPGVVEGRGDEKPPHY